MKITTFIAVGAFTLMSAGLASASDNKHADYHDRVSTTQSVGTAVAAQDHQGKFCQINMEREDGTGGTLVPESGRETGDNKYRNF